MTQSIPPTADRLPAADRLWWPDRGRIPSLDGLRSLAIAGVVGYHAANAATQVRARHDYDGPFRFLLNGELGVDVFFVLSGFLITLLLTREQDRTGRVAMSVGRSASGPPRSPTGSSSGRFSPCRPGYPPAPACRRRRSH